MLMRTVGAREIGAAPAPDIMMKQGSHSSSAALPSFALETRQKVVTARIRSTFIFILVVLLYSRQSRCFEISERDERKSCRECSNFKSSGLYSRGHVCRLSAEDVNCSTDGGVHLCIIMSKSCILDQGPLSWTSPVHYGSLSLHGTECHLATAKIHFAHSILAMQIFFRGFCHGLI